LTHIIINMIERDILGYDNYSNITRIEYPTEDTPEFITNEYDDMPELVTDDELEIEIDNSVNIFLERLNYFQTRLEFQEIMSEFDL
jgi:hypothetical protein